MSPESPQSQAAQQFKSTAARKAAVAAGFIFVAAIAGLLLHPAWPSDAAPQSAKPVQSSEPWSAAQTVTPTTLAKELSDSPASRRPTVVCVGFRILYEGAHIPGASFHGPAWNQQGLADLKEWAEPLPRSTNIVVYCGCCPLAHCPTLRPAFATLRQMGFTRLRVLLIPNDFATDWIKAGYPIAKGK